MAETKKRAKKAAKKMGRPSKFDTVNQRTIKWMAEKGATDVEICEVIGIDEKTLNNWKHTHPEFFQSLKDSKAVADARVTRSLYERATGYSCPETKVAFHEGIPVEHKVIKHYPPSEVAGNLLA